MSENKKWLKNADIRAGKVPGWPDKPETNGDPFDPDNMARTDAAVVVSDGMVLKNVASAIAGKRVSYERLFFIPVNIAFWGFISVALLNSTAGMTAKEFITKIVPKEISEKSSNDDDDFVEHRVSSAEEHKKAIAKRKEQEQLETDKEASKISDGTKAHQMIQKFYAGSKEGVARNYDLTALGELYAGGKYKSVIENRFADYQRPNDKFEAMLQEFTEIFPKTTSTYCESDNRRYAQTWHSSVAKANLESIIGTWKAGYIPFSDSVVKVSNVKELMNHKLDKDNNCNNFNVAVLEVDAGALKYMMSVTARTHTEASKNDIASALYLLGRLEKKNVATLVACNNCENVPAFTSPTTALNKNQAAANSIRVLKGLKKGSAAVIEEFEDAGFKLDGENK